MHELDLVFLKKQAEKQTIYCELTHCNALTAERFIGGKLGIY